ncbi:MAG: hypothetical protein HPY62_02250 [Bacteroidales bacterium]|nr:hypothetical protein [Bacteroidales bacterium]
MKTKAFLLSFIFLCIGLMKLSAQSVSSDLNRSFSYDIEWGWYTPVYCQGIEIDNLSAELTWHITTHYKDGIWQWDIMEVHGTATSSSGEVFKVKEKDKIAGPQKSIAELYTWHYNLIGDRGSHYIGYMTWNFVTGEFTVEKTVCK